MRKRNCEVLVQTKQGGAVGARTRIPRRFLTTFSNRVSRLQILQHPRRFQNRFNVTRLASIFESFECLSPVRRQFQRF